jgi:hypothetical protein
MTARRKTARRKSSHLALVQTLPTRPSLQRRVLRMLPRPRIMIACSLALFAIGAIYATWPAGASRLHHSPQPTQAASPASVTAKSRDAETAKREHQLASTQQHVLMARVY